MKLTLKNIELARVISFLEREDFKGVKSIMRSKVTQDLSKHLEEVVEGEEKIIKDFEDDQERRREELKAFSDVTVTVEGDNFVKPLNVIKAHIKKVSNDESDREFNGEDAFALYVLYEAFNLDEGDVENESDDHRD